jgi:hypothetical protein
MQSRTTTVWISLNPSAAESRIVIYYGVRSIPRPWSLVREELDDHFGFPVVARIEEANDYFKEKLHQLLETAWPSPRRSF